MIITKFRNLIRKFANPSLSASYTYQKEFRISDKNKIEKIQWNRLKKIIDWSYNNSKYYRRIFDSANITPDLIVSPEDLEKIPITTKKDLRDNFLEVQVASEMTKPYDSTSTSGSTGEPFKFFENKDARSNPLAAYSLTMDYWGISSLPVVNKLVIKRLHYKHQLPKSLLTRIKETFFGKSIRVEAHDLNLENALELCKLIKSENINLVYGFGSCLYSFTNFVDKLDMDVKVPFIISIGDGVTESEQKRMETVFSSRLFRDYSSSECMRMGFESIVTKNAYYLDLYNYFFEYIPAGPKKFKLVVTNFNNKIFPFIRYSIGDLVSFVDNCDEKNINYPLVRVYGKEIETITTPKNKELTLYFFAYIFEYQDEFISQFRVTQVSEHKIEIEIVPIKEIPSDLLDKLIDEIDEYTENSMEIAIKQVEKITFEQSGKIKLINSLKE